MKKLALAIIACLAVGASAQTRHYSTGDSIVTALPGGDKIETRLVEVFPATVVPVTTTPVLITVPSNEARVLHVRGYDGNDDTATTLDRLYYPENVYYEVITTRKTTNIRND